MNEHSAPTLGHLNEANEALNINRDHLAEEIKAFSKKFTELSGAIVALECRNAKLKKDLSAEVLRNAMLSSENEELKQSIEKYIATQKALIRDLDRALEVKWYRKLLRR